MEYVFDVGIYPSLTLGKTCWDCPKRLPRWGLSVAPVRTSSIQVFQRRARVRRGRSRPSRVRKSISANWYWCDGYL